MAIRSKESSRRIGSKGLRPVATTTRHQCRGGPFLPVSQVPNGYRGEDIVLDNRWARCTIRKCALTQTHQNVIDALFLHARVLKTAKDGQILIVYSVYEVLKALGHKHPNGHGSWLSQKLEELHDTRVDLETKDFRITSGIVRKHAKSLVDNDAAQRRGGIAKGAKLNYVIFESEYAKFFRLDLRIHYAALIPRILALRHAVTQALVRFCLSHDSVNMAMREILSALGAIDHDTTARWAREILARIRSESEVLERDFGIKIRPMENGQEGVFYRKHPEVWFESPEKSLSDPGMNRPPDVSSLTGLPVLAEPV